MIPGPKAGDDMAGSETFDILKNPFVLLNLPPEASREDVVTAYEDGISDGNADEGELREARRRLLAPKLRLEATVEFFPDATQVEREEVVAALRQKYPLSHQIALAKRLPSFARTIFLSQIAQLWPSSGILRFFVASRAQVEPGHVAETIAEFLASSGHPRPQTDAIIQFVDEVTLRNAARLFAQYDQVGKAADDLTRCLEEELPEATNEQISVLTLVVDAYVAKALPSLQAARLEVENAVETLRQNPTASSGTKVLISHLEKWDRIAQPQQLLASRKGRDEGGARDLFQFVRGLMLELANERDQPTIALEINKACLSVFAELPRAEQQLRVDQESLENLVDQELLHELDEFISKVKKDPDPLVRDLNIKGFEDDAVGNAGRLYAIFNRSLAKTKGTNAAEYAWGFLRGLALELNNNLGEASASQRMIEGLYYHPKFSDAPAKMREAIANDLQTVRSNAIHSKLNRAIQQKDRKQAKVHLTELISITTDPSERQQYQHTVNQIDAANRARNMKLAFWGVVGIVLVIAAAMNQGNRSGSYSASATSSYSKPAAPQTASEEEHMPPVGKAFPFSRSNIRYCLYQSARLDAAKTLIANETVDRIINAFNQQIDDFNSRCSSYKYYADDMSVVKIEVVQKQNLLANEGKRLVVNWRTGS